MTTEDYINKAVASGSRYEIVTASNGVMLELDINQWIVAGWTPLGAPLFVSSQPKPWFQAVTRGQ